MLNPSTQYPLGLPRSTRVVRFYLCAEQPRLDILKRVLGEFININPAVIFCWVELYVCPFKCTSNRLLILTINFVCFS